MSADESMVDRVARTLFERSMDALEVAFETRRGRPTYDSFNKKKQDKWRFVARAAIKVMREPTEAMRLNGFHEGFLSGADCDESHAVYIYRGFIDAALKETVTA